MSDLERRLRAYYGRLNARSEVRDEPAPLEQAFVTEHAGRTTLTAPASSLSYNPHFTYVAGRLVGGEKANRNGAYWSADDLQFGLPTVTHGPVNWLHEARHVVGSITTSGLVVDDPEVGEPHISVNTALWKWLYPDESAVVQMASDANSLWLSMECIAQSVQCVGDGGCGQSFPYQQVVRDQAAACEHIRERSATRRMVDPTFLGTALIVPPVRPGWAEADARVLETAAELAPRTYARAGEPSVTASAWEQLMAQVIRFHES